MNAPLEAIHKRLSWIAPYRGGGKVKKVLAFSEKKKKCTIEVCVLASFAKTKNCQLNTFEIREFYAS